MKRFFVWVLIIIILFVGVACSLISATSDGWLYFVSLIGTLLITIPAINWWRDYFYNLFDIEN